MSLVDSHSNCETADAEQPKYLPLSQNQRLIWLGQKLSPDVPLYEMVHLFTIHGSLDEQSFQTAFRRLVDATEILRLICLDSRDSPESLQVQPHCAADCEYVDLTNESDGDESLRRFVSERSASHLNVTNALYDAVLLKLAGEKYCWFLKLHHLLTDGLNGQAVMSALEQQYVALLTNTVAPESPKYRHYLDYEAALSSRPDFCEHQKWWADRSVDYRGSKFFRARVSADSPVHDRIVVNLGKGTSDSVRALAMTAPFRQLTPSLSCFNVFAVALLAWLYRLEGHADVCVGATSHGRMTPQFRNTIGLFMQLLPLTAEISKQETFESLSQKLAVEASGFFKHAVPGVTVPATQKCFDVAINFLNLSIGPFAGLPASMEWIHNGYGDPRRRLTISIQERSDECGFELIFDFNRAAFDDSEKSRAVDQFRNVLQSISTRPDTQLDEFEFLTAGERSFLTKHLGVPQELASQNVWERFGAIAETSPNETALRDDHGTLSYAELKQCALKLADLLRASDCGPVVPLLCRRDTNAVVAMLGILAAGRCFMPVDIDQPQTRVQELMENSGALFAVNANGQPFLEPLQQFLLTRGREARVSDYDSRIPRAMTVHDLLGCAVTSTKPIENDLANGACYVLSTSGSTGRPNAVVVSHESLWNLLQNFERLAPLGQVNCSWWTSVGFDVAIYEIFSAVLFGRTLCIPGESVRTSAADLFFWLEKQQIQSAYLPPFFLDEFDQFVSDHPGSELKRLLVGVEPIPQRLLASIATRMPDLMLINGYGPTEATICATLMVIDVDDQSEQPASIGRPVDGNVLRIVDSFSNAVPVGVAGELLIGGAGVARGYLGNTDLTRERFIRDDTDQRASVWYRTGDRVRLRADGNLEFLGRIDEQLKIRGHRIEPAEVVAAIRGIDGITDAAVICLKTENAAELAAFVTSADDVDVAALRAQLLSRLPRYMVPGRLIPVLNLPRTSNGKVDVVALSKLAAEQESSNPSEMITPGNPLEFALLTIWQRILGIAALSVTDNFFESGGDSLDAMKVVTEAENLGVHLTINDVFTHPTVAELAASAAHETDRRPGPPSTLRTSSSWASATHAKQNRKNGEVSLTAGQRGLWYLAQAYPDDRAYHLQIRFDVRGDFDHAVASECFCELIRHHEALRTTIQVVDGRPVAIVGSAHDSLVAVHDLLSTPSEDQSLAVEQILNKEATTPFDLSSSPLIRMLLIRLTGAEHCMAITAHHIAVDQQSMLILLEQFEQLYRNRCTGISTSLKPSVPFSEYAAWKNGRRIEAAQSADLAAWVAKLRQCATEIDLPRDHHRRGIRSLVGASQSFDLSDDLSASLRRLARSHKVSLNVFLLSVFKILLYRYSGETDFIVGVPVSHRPGQRFEGTVGYFVESVPLPCHVAGHDSIERCCAQTNDCVRNALSLPDLSLTEIVNNINPDRTTAANPLFQTMFVMQQALRTLNPTDDVSLQPSIADLKTSKFDLTMFVSDAKEMLQCVIEYSTELFERATIERMAQHWNNLLASIVAQPSLPIDDLEMMTVEDHAAITMTAANSSRQQPRQSVGASDECIHQLFEAQVQICPAAAALMFEDTTLTYAELNQRADRVAARLMRLGVQPETTVAVCCERSAELIIGILGILKAGGAYVPLDPQQPPARLQQLVSDAGAVAVLTQSQLHDRVADASMCVVDLDAEQDEFGDNDLTGRALPSAESLAYVMYTSGSTGKPKGVEITHEALVRSTRARFAFYKQQPERFLLLSSVWFDSSVAGIFWTLCSGGTLVVLPEGRQHDIKTLAADIAECGITHMLCLPSLYQLLLRHAAAGQLSSLQNVVVAGEACSGAVVADHFQTLPDTRLFNEYGPTEAAVWATVHELKQGDCHSQVPIGKSVDDVEVRVLDAHQRPVPIGVRGEIYLGGSRLARGYRDRADLTAENFICLPQEHTSDDRWYRTGDLARLRADGSLVFLGRGDDQMKVNGQRIEPAEIEAVLKAAEGVTEVVVGQTEPDDATSATGVTDLVDILKRLPADVADGLLSEAEHSASPAVDLATQASSLQFAASNSDPKVQLRLELASDCIVTPRARQRKWLVDQVLQESVSDLRALDRMARQMVPGSDQPHLPRDLQTERMSGQEIMEDWQTPLMQAMVAYATESHGDLLEIGFGRGVSASLIQQAGVRSHTIVEANPFSVSDFYHPWRNRYPDRDIQLIEGRWQDVGNQLQTYDSVFFHAFPMNEAEFVQHIANSSTFAEHFFPAAAQLLRTHGVFTYLTTEIDSLSRRHQRSLFRHFREVRMHVQRVSVPPDTRDAWWADSMVVLRATK